MQLIETIFSLSFLSLVIRLAIPITLGAVGGTFSERSGVINLGIEGMMLFGAFGAVLGTHLTSNPWMGVLSAMLIGGLVGILHAYLSVKLKANQVVCGVGINMIASGFTTVMVKAVWGKEGMSGNVESIKNFNIPGLSQIPVLGALFSDLSPFVPITLFIVFAGWYFLYQTKLGLRLRSIGDYPKAAETAGIRVNRYRYIFVTLSGALAGLGGAYLSIVQNNLFVRDMVAGRGFMALTANIFGGWNPLGSFVASLVFAAAQALRLNLSGYQILDSLIQMIPYAVTLLVLILAGRKTKAPAALGEVDTVA